MVRGKGRCDFSCSVWALVAVSQQIAVDQLFIFCAFRKEFITYVLQRCFLRKIMLGKNAVCSQLFDLGSNAGDDILHFSLF